MNLQNYKEHNIDNRFVNSVVPDICKKEECYLGIDEAGRGPVLGPMVYGACYCPLNKDEDLKSLGAADSKTLSEDKREELFKLIDSNNSYIGWELEIISPTFISNSMFKRPKVSLNEISHNAAIGLIQRALDAGVKLKQVFLDTVGDPAKYQAKLEVLFPTLSITVSKKADSLFPIVSAASICAKVARDRVLKDWQFPEGIQVDSWGSGYPGDGVTKNFLLNSMNPVFGFPGLVRFSWSTADKILKEKCVNIQWDEDDEQGKKDKENTPSVLQFFAVKNNTAAKDVKKEKETTGKRHFFFSDRDLNLVKEF